MIHFRALEPIQSLNFLDFFGAQTTFMIHLHAASLYPHFAEHLRRDLIAVCRTGLFALSSFPTTHTGQGRLRCPSITAPSP